MAENNVRVFVAREREPEPVPQHVRDEVVISLALQTVPPSKLTQFIAKYGDHRARGKNSWAAVRDTVRELGLL